MTRFAEMDNGLSLIRRSPLCLTSRLSGAVRDSLCDQVVLESTIEHELVHTRYKQEGETILEYRTWCSIVDLHISTSHHLFPPLLFAL